MKSRLLFALAPIVLFVSVFGQQCRFSEDELGNKLDKFQAECLEKGFSESTLEGCTSTVEKKMKKKSSMKKCASLDQYLSKCGVKCEQDELEEPDKLEENDMQSEECPEDSPQVNCFMDPCQDAVCANYPNASCTPYYCGDCSGRFHDEMGNIITNCSEDKKEDCEAGHYMTDNGCEQCPENTWSEAGASSCSQCPEGQMSDAGSTSQEDCHIQEATEPSMEKPDSEHHSEDCPEDSPQVTCFTNPCQDAVCANYPEASCTPYFCGDCSGRFHDEMGNMITNCSEEVAEPSMNKPDSVIQSSTLSWSGKPQSAELAIDGDMET